MRDVSLWLLDEEGVGPREGAAVSSVEAFASDCACY